MRPVGRHHSPPCGPGISAVTPLLSTGVPDSAPGTLHAQAPELVEEGWGLYGVVLGVSFSGVETEAAPGCVT